MKCFDNITEAIGNTPLVRLNRLNAGFAAVLCKLEYFNPMSSIKDRVALNIIDKAIANNELVPGGTIIEATSGNTGIGLAMVAAALGYKLIIVMPESMSQERKLLLKHLGAQLILTPASGGMAGAVSRAEQLANTIPQAFMARQFTNPAAQEVHYYTTAEEIWRDTEEKVDIFVAGVGTGGTVSGVARLLKEKKSTVQVIAVEPAESAVISGGAAAVHGIQGIGAGFVPENYDDSLVDKVVTVSTREALQFARLAAAKEGIIAGISGGANLKVACDLAQKKENDGKVIVTVIPDSAERYLSTDLFKDNEK